MDWTILIATTLVTAAVVALVAREVARRLGCAGRDLGAGVLLFAIVISLVVLQGAAKLAVLVEGLFVRQGIDPETALGGQFYLMVYAASFVPIAAYVVTLLVMYRKVRARQ
ncbi:hypothetical protein [Sinisalibacter lacisalsi]|uniref:Uncharacterized protein n=1 Tax=Sinisalibacter lacisalsi TaxID=1526570 RepID=A0ABQ1QXR5_9RHOB|nr:hypothetical protein [Sinisalibacter lacisalsi]GGD46591.1 hypothetical protein GCM10011358_32900 [Sinisalibacter lacisalsi]